MKKRSFLWLRVSAFFMALAVICTVMLQTGGSQALSKYGSSGSEVREIQTKLKNWGYYSGSVDGVYGAETRNAVISFQKKNGLTADGICGTKTLAALGISSGSSSSSGYGGYTANEFNLLARIISAEARGEPYEGQVAVGAVVINRVLSSVYPSTLSGVIYQSGQFEPVSTGRLALALAENRATSRCYQAADEAMSGITNVGTCVYFRTPIPGLEGIRIGGHVFY